MSCTTTMKRSLCHSLVLLVMLFSIRAEAKYRTDIFIPGTKANPVWYYAPAGENFMQKWGLNPGDTVAIRVGPAGENYFNNIDIHNAVINGITLINHFGNRLQIDIGFIALGGQARDIKVLGNGSPFLKYGFKFFDSKHFGLSISSVGDFEAAWLEFDGCNMGVQVVTTTYETYVANYQNVNLHHLLVKNVSDEALYLGWVNDSPILMDLWVHDNIIRNSGRDGIQTRNTRKTLIENNDLDSVGMRGDWGHDHAILLGNNKDGAIVRNNKVRNTHGIGIWNDGFGNFLYQCNDIQSQGEALYTRPYNPDRATTDWGDSENIGFQTVTAKDNILTSDKGIAGAWLYMPQANKVVTFMATNNKTAGRWGIPAGVLFANTNNNLFAVPACGSLNIPLPVKLISFSAVKQGKAAVVKWSAEETAFDRYELERSSDALHFQKWAVVAGGQREYSYTDLFPYPTTYYRLKMIDQNGSFSYSKVVMVKVNGQIKYKIYNIAGAEFQSKENLRRGLYVVIYEDGTKEFLNIQQ